MADVLDFIGEGGCRCNPEVAEEDNSKKNSLPVTCDKCDKCYLAQIPRAKEDSCQCKHERPSLNRYAICADCSLTNEKYAIAANVAAGRIIAQHFCRENKYEHEENLNFSRSARYSRIKRLVDCKLCFETMHRKALLRRFSTTPNTFRRSLEERIIMALVSAGGELPNEDVAQRTAEKCMHNWMEFEVSFQLVRRRKRPAQAYKEPKNWFQHLTYSVEEK